MPMGLTQKLDVLMKAMPKLKIDTEKINNADPLSKQAFVHYLDTTKTVISESILKDQPSKTFAILRRVGYEPRDFVEYINHNKRYSFNPGTIYYKFAQDLGFSDPVSIARNSDSVLYKALTTIFNIATPTYRDKIIRNTELKKELSKAEEDEDRADVLFNNLAFENLRQI